MSSGTPWPQSTIATSTRLLLLRCTLICSSRCSGGSCCIASMPFLIRLSSTCSIRIGSTLTAGRLAARCTLITEPKRRASISAIASAASMMSDGGHGLHTGSLCFTNSRTRRTILPARSACAVIFSITGISDSGVARPWRRRSTQPAW
ncbi:hypothetical protein D3C72_1990690 [compost metagenome]